jgi:hypothetical protein
MAVIAAATVIAAGLVVLPGSLQEAQANPCSTGGEGRELPVPVPPTPSGDIDIDCVFNGDLELNEGLLR